MFLCARADIGVSARTNSFTSLSLALHPVPPRSPYADELMHPNGRGADAQKEKNLFFLVVACWKREEKNVQFLVFNPQDPQAPQAPQAP
jgi:hypothetical protein